MKLKLYFTLFLMMAAMNLPAQKKIYLRTDYKEVFSPTLADRYGIITYHNDSGKHVKIYYMNDVLLEEAMYAPSFEHDTYSEGSIKGWRKIYHYSGRVYTEGYFASEMKQGIWKTYYRDGTLKSEVNYLEGVEHGLCSYYGTRGQLLRTSTYQYGYLHGTTKLFSNGRVLIEKQYENDTLNGRYILYDTTGKVKHYCYMVKGQCDDGTDIHIMLNLPSIMAQFPGNRLSEYIDRNLKYPDEAEKHEVGGTVEIEFSVDSTGDISYINFIGRELGFGLEEEVNRLFSGMPLWEPGYNNGIPIPVYFTMPITFQLSKGEDGE